MEFINHLEAGRKAAQYVKYRWPKMFQFKKLDSVCKAFYVHTASNLHSQDPVKFEKRPLQSKTSEIWRVISFFSSPHPFQEI